MGLPLFVSERETAMLTSIVIDSREPAEYRLDWQAPSVVQKLSAGDYWLTTDDGRLIIVERKTYTDLLSSIKDGRFLAQVAEMLTLSKWAVVVIEGTAVRGSRGGLLTGGKYGRETGWSWASVQGALQSAQELGASVTYTGAEPDPIVFTAELERIGQRSSNAIPTARREAVALDPAELILTALPGIGTHKAAKLLDYTGGSAAMALWYLTQPDGDNADKINGIGPKTREGVRKALGLRNDEELLIVSF